MEFEIGIMNSESTELYKESKKYLIETNKFLSKLQTHMEDLILTKSRIESEIVSLISHEGKLKGNHDFEPLRGEFEVLQEKMDSIASKFVLIAKNEKSVRKTLFFRAKHMVTKLEKSRWSCYHILHKYVLTQIKMVAQRTSSEDWIYALESVDMFNKILHPESSHSLHFHLHEDKHQFENCRPTIIRPITVSKILQIVASERTWIGAKEISKSVSVGLEANNVNFVSEEFEWLTVSNKVLQNDTKYEFKKREDKTAIEEGSPTSDYFSQNGGGGGKNFLKKEPQNHKDFVDNYVASEEIFINNFFSYLCKVPGLLNEGVIKRTKSGETICKYVRVHMAEFYHDILWPGIGRMASSLLLWGNETEAQNSIPFAFQHPQLSLSIGHMLQEYLSAPIEDGYPPLAFPCIQILVESLNLHAISSAWDLQYMACVSEASKLKTEIMPLKNGVCGNMTSVTGKLLCDALKMLASCNNRCSPDVLGNFVDHGTHDPEDFPFLEELHVMRRLQATLFCLRNWARQRGDTALRSWQFKDFVMITQNDVVNAQLACQNLVLSDHTHLQNTKNISISLFIHVQQMLSKDINECLRTIKSLPKNFQDEMARICRTISLATLQNIFPSSSFWKKSISSAPKTKCDYVDELIERILGPVFSALDDLKEEVQQTIGRIAIKTFCDAWLEHIKICKIKFSEWGARQLKLDFIGLRTWIDENPYIREDTRRYLLLLDSLRQCEGVAKLLITKQGELVDVKPHKNKIIPLDGTNDQRSASPVNKILEAIPAELYVQDQQQWINLKSSTSLLSVPFCCK